MTYFALNQKLGLAKHIVDIMDADLVEDYTVIIDAMSEKGKGGGQVNERDLM